MLDQVKEESSKFMKEQASLIEEGERDDENEQPELTNPITSNFEFEVLHTIMCQDCGACVKKVEIFNDMSVDMPRRRDMFTVKSLQDAVDQFFKKEKIEWSCEQCDGKTAVYEHKVARLPR